MNIFDLHNDMIKPSDNGGFESVVDSATNEFLISVVYNSKSL